MTSKPTGATTGPAREEASPPDKTPDRSSGKPPATVVGDWPTAEAQAVVVASTSPALTDDRGVRCTRCEHRHCIFDRLDGEIDTESFCPNCGATTFAVLNHCAICHEIFGPRGGLRASPSELHCIRCIEAGRSNKYDPEPEPDIATDGGQIVARRGCLDHELEEFRREQITPDVELVVYRCRECGDRESELVQEGNR